MLITKPQNMKNFIGMILVSFSFMLAVVDSVALSPRSSVYSLEQRPDMQAAEFTASLRVFPQYGTPITVYPVNTTLVSQLKEVSPTANSPPQLAG